MNHLNDLRTTSSVFGMMFSALSNKHKVTTRESLTVKVIRQQNDWHESVHDVIDIPLVYSPITAAFTIRERLLWFSCNKYV
jgi:hypothetical protein